MVKLNRIQKSYIASELRNYHKNKEMLEELRKDIILATPSFPEVKGCTTNEFKSSTESLVIRLIRDRNISYLQNVINAVEGMLLEVDEDKLRLIRLKYWQKRKHKDIFIADKLSIARPTLYRWNDEIIFKVGKNLGMVN